MLTVSDVNKKIFGKSYHEKLLLKTNFVWYRNSLSEVDTLSIVMCLIDKGIIRESVR